MKLVLIKNLHSKLIGFIILFFILTPRQANAQAAGIGTVGIIQTEQIVGNVGIGSTAPGQALDVQGTVRALGYVNSISLLTTASPSSASSFTISGLSPGRYRLIVLVTQNTSNGNFTMQFNNDSGNNYYPAVSAVNDVYTNNISVYYSGYFNTVIPLNDPTYPANAGNLNYFVFDFNCSGNDILGTLSGEITNQPVTNYLSSGVQGSFIYIGSATLSSITIKTSAGTMTGNAYLYQLY